MLGQISLHSAPGRMDVFPDHDAVAGRGLIVSCDPLSTCRLLRNPGPVDHVRNRRPGQVVNVESGNPRALSGTLPRPLCLKARPGDRHFLRKYPLPGACSAVWARSLRHHYWPVFRGVTRHGRIQTGRLTDQVGNRSEVQFGRRWT